MTRSSSASAPSTGCAGQSLIETCLAVALLCLLFFGLFQVSQVFAAREVLYHAAARGARARAVGFNHWMVTKVIRVAAIPNAGRMTEPVYENVNPALRTLVQTASPGEVWDTAVAATPVSAQYDIERARIPEYLDTWNWPRADYILNYEDWDSIHLTITGAGLLPEGALAPTVQVRVHQEYPLRAPMHRAYYAADSVALSGESELENHYALYLDDMDW